MPTNTFYNEQELLRRVADGDETAYKVLFVRYWDQIYSTALKFAKSPEMAEDAAQDVFAQIWAKRELLRKVKKFDGYLYIAARNLIFSKLSKKVYTQEFGDYFEEYFTDPFTDPERQLEFKEFDDIIQQGINSLTPGQQNVFRLSRFQGLSHEEIAEKTGLSKRTVKNYMVKAILSLRKYLSEHSDNLPIYLWITLYL